MTLTTRQIDGSFAHEVIGLRLWERQDDSTLAALRDLWSESGLLVFRRQSLTEDELSSFGAEFGRLQISARADWASPRCPEIAYISNLRAHDGHAIGGLGLGSLEWHTDESYLAVPVTGAMLYAVELPHPGGETHWASLSRAYHALPDELRRAIDGRFGVFSYARRMSSFSYARNLLGEQGADRTLIEEIKRQVPDVIHALTLVHPVTGRKSLYFDPTTTDGIVGMAQDDGASLLRELTEFATRPEFVYSHRWQIGDLVMWNNACLLHRRDDFEPSHLRFLKRTTITVPVDRHFALNGIPSTPV